MPELFMADATGATGKPLIRVHTAGSVGGPRRSWRPAWCSPASTAACCRGLGEAVRVQCHVGVRASRCRSPSRSAPARAGTSPRMCAPTSAGRGTEQHRRDRRRQGPPQRGQESAGASASARHHRREGDGVADAVGPDPLRRDLPVLGRRRRDGDRRRGRSRTPGRRRPSRRLDPPPRCAPNRWRTPDATRSTRRPAATPRPRCGRPPGSPTRSRRSTSPRCTCRSPGTSRCGWRASGFAGRGRGLELTEAGETEIGGKIPFNASGGVLSSNPIGASA